MTAGGEDPLPVVSCDGCGHVDALRVGKCEGEARLAELRAQGWRLTATADTCPTCTLRASARLP